MQISRLFEIVYLLMDKKLMTADELAAHFEVSKRTILRDIDSLSAAGIPVFTMQGKGGGISIPDRFLLNKAVISKDDQQQILFALQGISATQHIETDGILRKLRSLFEKADRDWIEVDFSRWGNSSEDRRKFDLLKNAIINEQVISFTYYNSSGETTDRKVYPLKLVFKSRSWYLQAYCLLKNDYRIFKSTRMMDLAIIDEIFDSNVYSVPEIEQAEYQSTEMIELKLLFEPQAAYRVFDEFQEDSITKSEDGSYIVTLYIPHDYWVYEYVLSFGSSVEVIEPQSVREEILKQIEHMREIYTT